jgi:hypothetical protein
MSKGHHVNRRRNYGRRQHELHERRLRRETWDGFEVATTDVDDRLALELFDAMRPRGSRVFDLLTPRSRWLAEAG